MFVLDARYGWYAFQDGDAETLMGALNLKRTLSLSTQRLKHFRIPPRRTLKAKGEVLVFFSFTYSVHT